MPAGYSSGQARRPVRTPEPQFLVAPEEEGQPEGERQEPDGHRDRAKTIQSCRAPNDREDGTDGARDERDDSSEAGLTHPFSQQEPVEAQTDRDREADVENAVGHIEVRGVHQTGRNAQYREDSS